MELFSIQTEQASPEKLSLGVVKPLNSGIVHNLNRDVVSSVYKKSRMLFLVTESCGSLSDDLNQVAYYFMTNQELEYRVLKILEQQPDMTQRQLSEVLGVSLGKTNYLLRSLIDVGWIKLENFQKSDSKWGYVYLLTPMGVAEKAAITLRFLKRKKQEYNDLQSEIAQLQKEVQQQQQS
jgi:EPS-associated MarR family transcriptional regulator